jgi:hypothetical protein
MELGKVIVANDTKHEEVFKFVGVLHPVTNQIQKDKTILEWVQRALTLTADDLESMSMQDINKFLLMIPKAIMWLQDCVNRAIIKMESTEYEFEDVIVCPASLLGKKDFAEGTTSITKEMRLAKARELYPTEYDEIVRKMRASKNVVTRLDNQLKHLQTFNDNLKKVRESYAVAISQ